MLYDTLKPFLAKMCDIFNIDESHGLRHSEATMRYADILADTIADITEEQRHMALMAACVHDLCDSKYTDVVEASKLIKWWLVSEQWWKEDIANVLIDIITTMSYSKLTKSVDSNKTPVFPDHGKWQISYEIARNADLLESYTVARCVLYNKRLYPEKTEDEHWQRAKELFDSRVFNYVKDGWITLPGALALVPELEADAKRCLEERCMDWNMH